MILLLDNYDSFVYNLARYVRELGETPVVRRHDALTVDEVAAMAPSHFNSQPWRFVLIEDRGTIDRIARISADSMTQVMAEGTFFDRYKRYFRFSRQEMEEQRFGMLFDKLPAVLRPFTKKAFTPGGQAMMNRLRVPQTLGAENHKLVAGSPLLLGVMLDRHEYRKEELSGFYSVFSMGAAMENIWLATTELGLGIQFVSFPMETPGAWEEIEGLLRVPESLELMAVYRIGYLPPERRRPPRTRRSPPGRGPSAPAWPARCSRGSSSSPRR